MMYSWPEYVQLAITCWNEWRTFVYLINCHTLSDISYVGGAYMIETVTPIIIIIIIIITELPAIASTCVITLYYLLDHTEKYYILHEDARSRR